MEQINNSITGNYNIIYAINNKHYTSWVQQ